MKCVQTALKGLETGPQQCSLGGKINVMDVKGPMLTWCKYFASFVHFFFLNAGYSVYSAFCFMYIVSYKVHFMKLDTTIYVLWQVFVPILSN